MSFLSRLRSPDTAAPEPDEAPAPIPARPLPAGVLRRERRALERAREQAVRDLGGLVFELYRHGRFREDLVAEQCAALVGIDDRIDEIGELLATRRRPLPQCECGAPLLPGARFCASCGRPVAAALNGARPASAGEDTVIEPPAPEA
jgi:hypothetical protein